MNLQGELRIKVIIGSNAENLMVNTNNWLSDHHVHIITPIAFTALSFNDKEAVTDMEYAAIITYVENDS